MRWLLPALLLGISFLVEAINHNGDYRTLVVLEDDAEKSKYSKFIEDLEGKIIEELAKVEAFPLNPADVLAIAERGFALTFESPKNEKLALFHLGARAYDHVLILPSKSKGLGPNLTPKLLLDFVNSGGNILLTLSSSVPTPTSLVSLLLELDIHLPTDRNSLVVDHFNYDTITASEQHDVLLVPRPDAVRPDVVNFFKGDGTGNELIAFPRGVGQTLGNASPLLTPILRAPRTAYSYNPKEDVEGVEDPFAVGPQLSLVSTMQARNSARFTVVGSAEMLQDTWFDAKVKRSVGLGGVGTDAQKVPTSNREFAKEVSGWTFGEIGILQVNKVEHFLNEGTAESNITNPQMYRVKNEVTYSIVIREYAWDRYKKFVVPESDSIQLEFSMLSPFHRIHLAPGNTADGWGRYTASFKLPDQHGIFNFKVNYKRPFYTNIEEKNTVTVRHFAHDEWPRSWVISGAWPWISGISVTVVGWVAFVALWLWSKPVPLKLATSGKKLQ